MDGQNFGQVGFYNIKVRNLETDQGNEETQSNENMFKMVKQLVDDNKLNEYVQLKKLKNL